MGGEEGRRGRAGRKEWEEKKRHQSRTKREGKSKRKKRIWVQLGKKKKCSLPRALNRVTSRLGL